MARVPTLDEVSTIVAIPDAIVRNLRITQSYHELAVAVHARTGPGANWCAFATWASKQAGRTIRGEDLRAAVTGALEGVLDGQAATAVLDAVRELGRTAELQRVSQVLRSVVPVDAVVARTAEAVARGNRKVYEELAPFFVRFLAERASDASFDETAIEAFAAACRPGPPPDGQELLHRAFRHLYEALFEGDADRRAERLFWSNIEIGLHEQTRLQPDIRAALDAAIEDPDVLVARLLAELFPGRGWIVRARRFLKRLLGGPTPLDRAARLFVDTARERLRLALTEHVMVLELPGGERLRLGADLRGEFAVALARIEDATLSAFLGEVDPTPDGLESTGARDWADLADRMHFIADLFRSRHELARLFDAPFTAEQTAQLVAGHRPSGEL